MEYNIVYSHSIYFGIAPHLIILGYWHWEQMSMYSFVPYSFYVHYKQSFILLDFVLYAAISYTASNPFEILVLLGVWLFV